MKQLITILCTIILFTYCSKSKKKTSNNLVNKQDTISKPIETKLRKDLIETEIDSLNFAKEGKFKIILNQTRKATGTFLEVDLFTKVNTSWKSIQQLQFEKDGITGIAVEFIDFNNDGYKDVTFKNGVAARGANELRTLLIFDKNKEQLIHIKNSNHYPNLAYNEELNCIDAWLVYGGTATVFLKLEADSLREFAGVSSSDIREVYTIDKNGERNIISRKPTNDSVVFMRYSNYDPLTTY